jgi:DNA-binding transcriptional ArsR family regulator
MSLCPAAKTLPPVPPSVEAVFCTLAGHDPMTGAQLRETTGLPRRTIYEALRTLRGLGVLRERPSLRDSRQTFFWIAGRDAAPAAPAPPPRRTEGLPEWAVRAVSRKEGSPPR